MAGSFKGKSVVALLAINVLTQGASFGLQVLIAREFGASVNIDAYITGLALSQYVVLILNTGINASLLPAYYERPAEERDKFLADLTATIVLVGIGISVVGMLCSSWLFSVVFGDLPEETRVLGEKICLYSFPSVAGMLLVNILTSIHYIRERFSYQAIVPAIAQVVNLAVVFTFAALGVYSLLVAFMLSLGVQVLMLSPVLRTLTVQPRLVTPFGPAVRPFLLLIVPMLVSTPFIKATALWDRFLASMVAEGTSGIISHVDYASKIITGLAAVSISALPTVIFPSISAAIARKDQASFSKIVSDGLFFTFFLTAPVIGIGYFISIDLVRVLLERGRFTPADTIAVAAILKVYLFSIVLRGMGGVTGNALYALKLTNWVSIMGVLESLLYLGYSYLLAKQFGVIAIPISFILYFGGSIIWALILIRVKTGSRASPIDLRPYAKVIAVTVGATMATWAGRKLFGGSIVGLASAVLAGGVSYLVLSHFARIELARMTLNSIAQLSSRLLRRKIPAA